MPFTTDMMTAEQWREQAEMWERGQREFAEEAARLRAQRDKAMAALREIEDYAEGLEYTHSEVYEIARRTLAELEAGGQDDA